MITREDLKPFILDALRVHGGKARVVQVCKYIWDTYEMKIRQSGNLLYTWQYDVRWAAQKLRNAGVLKPMYGSKTKPWEIA